VTELQKFSANNEQMNRLCAAVTVRQEEDGNGQLSLNTVQSALHHGLQELRAFEQHRSNLSHLCQHLPDTVQGIQFYKDLYSGHNYNCCLCQLFKQILTS